MRSYSTCCCNNRWSLPSFCWGWNYVDTALPDSIVYFVRRLDPTISRSHSPSTISCFLAAYEWQRRCYQLTLFLHLFYPCRLRLVLLLFLYSKWTGWRPLPRQSQRSTSPPSHLSCLLPAACPSPCLTPSLMISLVLGSSLHLELWRKYFIDLLQPSHRHPTHFHSITINCPVLVLSTVQ